jgi:NitT/TauT family transport system substrate-binding protein
MFTNKKATLGISLAVVTVLASACGSDSGSESEQASADAAPQTLAVGSLPIPDMAPIIWADDKGLFAEENLDVELKPLQGGPVGIQMITTGELQFSFGNPISTMIATDKGSPVTTIAQLAGVGPNEIGIYVAPDSPVQSMVDLDGKTIATNTTNNVGDITFASLAASKGLDVTPKWVEVPYPEIADGVLGGAVEAGFFPEPFAAAARIAGLRQVVDLTEGANQDLPISSALTSAEFLKEQPETVAAFTRAINKAREQMAADEDAFRQWWPGVSGASPEIAAGMNLPDFGASFEDDKWQSLADTLADLGLVSPEYQASEFIWRAEDE